MNFVLGSTVLLALSELTSGSSFLRSRHLADLDLVGGAENLVCTKKNEEANPFVYSGVIKKDGEKYLLQNYGDGLFLGSNNRYGSKDTAIAFTAPTAPTDQYTWTSNDITCKQTSDQYPTEPEIVHVNLNCFHDGNFRFYGAKAVKKGDSFVIVRPYKPWYFGPSTNENPTWQDKADSNAKFTKNGESYTSDKFTCSPTSLSAPPPQGSGTPPAVNTTSEVNNTATVNSPPAVNTTSAVDTPPAVNNTATVNAPPAVNTTSEVKTPPALDTPPAPAPKNETKTETAPAPAPKNETKTETAPAPAPKNETKTDTPPAPAPKNETKTETKTKTESKPKPTFVSNLTTLAEVHKFHLKCGVFKTNKEKAGDVSIEQKLTDTGYVYYAKKWISNDVTQLWMKSDTDKWDSNGELAMTFTLGGTSGTDWISEDGKRWCANDKPPEYEM